MLTGSHDTLMANREKLCEDRQKVPWPPWVCRSGCYTTERVFAHFAVRPPASVSVINYLLIVSACNMMSLCGFWDASDSQINRDAHKNTSHPLPVVK